MRFDLYSELRVVDRDPESADFDNPYGEIIDEVFFIRAEAPDGSRWIGPALGVRPSQAEIEVAIELAEFGYMHCSLEPSEVWAATYPCYGSAAYIDMEPDIVFNERQEALAA